VAEPDDGKSFGQQGDMGLVLRLIADVAAGAAHEINNPLTVISGRAQLMRETTDDPQAQAAWDAIATQAHRISNIISELMEFASPAPPKPEPIDPAGLLDEVLSQAAGRILPNEPGPQFDKKIEADTPDIWADRAQLQVVLHELIDNARIACNTGGCIKLSARPDVAGNVLLCVEDDGCGMDAETLAAAMTPFYSARKAGRGKGLGLARAWRYVVNNDGQFWIDSQIWQGTSAYLCLPAN
jgi:two-component system, NtrC family, sensor kinase